MKWKLCLILLFYGLTGIAQQSEIKGVVSIFNSETLTGKRQYVVSAQVSDDFGKAQTTATDYKGQFTLIYVGVNEKATVSFNIKSPGLSVVNTDALTAIAGQFDSKKISMANPDSIDAYRRRIYNIGRTEAQKHLEKQVENKNRELADLRKNNIQNKNKIEQLKRELVDLVDRQSKIEQQAQELAKTYASINLDDASPQFRKAFGAFQKGYVDSAIFILKKTNTAGSVDSIRLEERKINDFKRSIDKRDSILKQRKKDKGDMLLLEAELHTTQNEPKKAVANYELLIRLDSANTDYLSKYATFLNWLNKFNQAIYYYKIVLKIYRANPTLNPDGIAFVQNNLGLLYCDNYDFVNASEAFMESQEIFKRKYGSDTKTYAPYKALAEHNWGVFYERKNDLTKAAAEFQIALNLYKDLAIDNPEEYERNVETALSNLGLVFELTDNFGAAEVVYQKAIEISNRLAIKNPATYEPEVARVQLNLGVLFARENNLTKASIIYGEALATYKRLVKKNPESYEVNLAGAESNMGSLFVRQNDLIKAEAIYNDALEIFRRRSRDEPLAYERLVAETIVNLGNVYQKANNFPKAISTLQDALKIVRSLSANAPEAYEQEVIDIQNALADLYLDAKNYLRAENYFLKSLNIERRHDNLVEGNYKSETGAALNLLMVNFEFLKAQKYDSFKKDNPDYFEIAEKSLLLESAKDTIIAQQLAIYYNNRCWYLLFASKFNEAQRAAEKGLTMENSFTKHTSSLAVNLAHSLLLQGRYYDALSIYKKILTQQPLNRLAIIDAWMKNFSELEANGIKSKNIDKIRAFLKNPVQESVR